MKIKSIFIISLVFIMIGHQFFSPEAWAADKINPFSALSVTEFRALPFYEQIDYLKMLRTFYRQYEHIEFARGWLLAAGSASVNEQYSAIESILTKIGDKIGSTVLQEATCEAGTNTEAGTCSCGGMVGKLTNDAGRLYCQCQQCTIKETNSRGVLCSPLYGNDLCIQPPAGKRKNEVANTCFEEGNKFPDTRSYTKAIASQFEKDMRDVCSKTYAVDRIQNDQSATCKSLAAHLGAYRKKLNQAKPTKIQKNKKTNKTTTKAVDPGTNQNPTQNPNNNKSGPTADSATDDSTAPTIGAVPKNNSVPIAEPVNNLASITDSKPANNSPAGLTAPANPTTVRTSIPIDTTIHPEPQNSPPAFPAFNDTGSGKIPTSPTGAQNTFKLPEYSGKMDNESAIACYNALVAESGATNRIPNGYCAFPFDGACSENGITSNPNKVGIYVYSKNSIEFIPMAREKLNAAINTLSTPNVDIENALTKLRNGNQKIIEATPEARKLFSFELVRYGAYSTDIPIANDIINQLKDKIDISQLSELTKTVANLSPPDPHDTLPIDNGQRAELKQMHDMGMTVPPIDMVAKVYAVASKSSYACNASDNTSGDKANDNFKVCNYARDLMESVSTLTRYYEIAQKSPVARENINSKRTAIGAALKKCTEIKDDQTVTKTFGIYYEQLNPSNGSGPAQEPKPATGANPATMQ